MKRVCLLIVGFLLAAVPALAQDGGWRLVGAQRLSELIPGEYTFESVRLSPDGTMLVWVERDAGEWCVYTFADEAVNCVAVPEEADFGIARHNLPVWSPDSTELAVTENFMLMASDSDIWTFDVAEGTFTNRTDDGYYGSILSDEEPDETPYDYLPAYNPADGLLYFFRSVVRDDVEPGSTFVLWRLPGEGDAELVVDLTDAMPGPYPVFRQPAFSPDGTQLAFSVLPVNDRTNPARGIWLLDMETLEARQAAAFTDIETYNPEWTGGEMEPYNLMWADGGLVIETVNPARGASAAAKAAFYVDVETGAVTPLLDLSQYNSADALVADDSDSSAAASMPIAGVVSPDGSTYWYLSYAFVFERAAVRSAPLPFTGDAPQVEMPMEFWQVSASHGENATMGGDKALIYDLLLTFEQV